MRFTRESTALVVALAFVSACSSGSEIIEGVEVSSGVIKAASVKTQAIKSARIAMTMDVEIDGEESTITGSGVFAFSELKGVMTMDFGSPLLGTIETRMLGETMYLKSEALLEQSGKTWVKMDFDELAKQTGVDIGQLQQYQSQNPASALSFLQGVASVRKVGSGSVRGVATTHYKATVDLKRIPADLPSSVRANLKAMAEKLKVDSLPMEVWIAPDDVIRRLSYDIDISNTPNVGSGRTKATIEIFDFGVPVAVEAPPADEVADFADILGRR